MLTDVGHATLPQYLSVILLPLTCLLFMQLKHIKHFYVLDTTVAVETQRLKKC